MDGENDGLQAQGEVEQGLAGEPQEQGKGDYTHSVGYKTGSITYSPSSAL